MSQLEVVVIDYGVGNLLSVSRALEFCGASVILTSDPEKISRAERVVLPGVGAFGNGMQVLAELGLDIVVKAVAEHGIPLLGICLGMQMLFDESSEFGTTKGLGIIPGKVVAIPPRTTAGEPLKVPHIGWNALVRSTLADWHDSCLSGTAEGEAMYFVHSYMAVPANQSHRVADCVYGGHVVAAVVEKSNVIGCQFHPEKSGEAGLRILKEFCGI